MKEKEEVVKIEQILSERQLPENTGIHRLVGKNGEEIVISKSAPNGGFRYYQATIISDELGENEQLKLNVISDILSHIEESELCIKKQDRTSTSERAKPNYERRK